MFSYNWTEGLLCLISTSALKNQLTAIPSPPGAKENGECASSDDDLLGVGFRYKLKTADTAKVGLKAVEPVLYSTPMTGEKSALSQYACPNLTPTPYHPI